MLSAPSRHSNRCIFCAFHIRRLSLQSRRLRSTSNRRGAVALDPRISLSSSRKGPPQREPLVNRHGLPTIRKLWPGNWIGVPGRDISREELREVLATRLEAIRGELKGAPILEELRKERAAAGEKAQSFERLWKGFAQNLLHAEAGRVPSLVQEDPVQSQTRTSTHALRELHDVLRTRGQAGLDDRIKYEFYAYVIGSRFTPSDVRNQKTLADLRYPSEWFPATRILHRTIHLHVGPTNSGKTYHALQRLEQAENGVYAGPLRLLAHEIYTRMNAKGKLCSLITGEERRTAGADYTIGDAPLSSCTVEMMPLNKTLDVAVIDEIQMIGNAERGWAWTQALLGVKAKEVHLCGEERTVPLIRAICASVGEKLEIHHYERLSPLKVAEEGSLRGNLKQLRKGDCVVSFSVMGIHALRRQIERATGRKVATVYGSLPPETRAQQARLFNDPDNEYDFLVASDAVGMGLNLAIKRIIFESSTKFDGYSRRTLSVADIKQIAGRAGRYRIAEQAAKESTEDQDLATAKGDSAARPAGKADVGENVGIVTTLEPFDFPIVAEAMGSDPEPIRSAGLFPPAPVLERFASYFPPGTPFSYILTRLHELSQMHQRFHLCGLKDQVWIADLIEPVQGLTISDRNIICSAPAGKADKELWQKLMPAFARLVAEQSGGNLVDIKEMPLEVLEAEVSASREYLRELERLHKGVVGYLWLSYRFAGIFNTRALAFHVKTLVEEKIEYVLGQFSFSEASRRKIALQREKQLLREIENRKINADSDPIEGEGAAEEILEGQQEGVDEDGAVVDARARNLEEQRSLTAGGDRFGGEEDLGMEDLLEATFSDTERPSSTPFAQRERGQTEGENRDERELDLDATISDAATKTKDAHAAALQPARDETRSDHRPAAAGVTTSVAAGRDLEAPFSRGTEPASAGSTQMPAVPPKHLAQLDLNITEQERKIDSRP